MHQPIKALKSEIAKHVIGHSDLIDKLLIGLISDGHILIEGAPCFIETME